MKLLWSILCNRFIVDEQTNSASLIDVLEAIKIESKNLKENKIFIKFSLISLWFKEENDDCNKENNVVVEFYDPNEKKLNDFNYKFFLVRDKKRIRTAINFGELSFTVSGTYKFKIKLDNTLIEEVPLEIIVNQKTP